MPYKDKEKQNEQSRKWRRENSERHSEITRAQRARVLNKWKEYWRELYGEPKCQICGKKLTFDMSSDRSMWVNFDHREINISIKDAPTVWARMNKPTEEKKKLWLEANFGILCHVCNKMLNKPGREERMEWLEKAKKYVEQ